MAEQTRTVTAPEPGEKLSTMVYRSLRDMIIYGDFKPGQRLMPNDLVELFNVSSTPVREALTMLATDNFIEAVPRRGFRVGRPDRTRLVELWQVRRGLETTAGELIISKLEDHELGDMDLEKLADAQAQLESSGSQSHRDHVELNAGFHRTLVSLAGNDTLSSIYESVRLHIFGAWVQRDLPNWRNRLAAETAEHHEIIECLARRDEANFRHAIHAHIDRSLRDAVTDLKDSDSVEGGDS